MKIYDAKDKVIVRNDYCYTIITLGSIINLQIAKMHNSIALHLWGKEIDEENTAEEIIGCMINYIRENGDRDEEYYDLVIEKIEETESLIV